MTKLEPCPFCGSPPELTLPSDSNWHCASVSCENKRCVVKPHSCVERNPEKAIAAWNTRQAKATSPTREMIEAARDVADGVDDSAFKRIYLAMPGEVERDLLLAADYIDSDGGCLDGADADRIVQTLRSLGKTNPGSLR